MAKGFTITEFFRRFPDDDACLDLLMKVRYGETTDCPKCGRHGKFHRLHKEPAYSCQWCGHHIHPMQGTPFGRTRTPLQKWFYAMYLFTTTRNGVAAKEIQRQLGVTYKTAWRIGHEIRKYMGYVDGDPMLGGHIEADEAWVGGVTRGRQSHTNKTIIFGMVERNGNVRTAPIKGRSRYYIEPEILDHVEPGTTISTDELAVYKILPELGYRHGSVNHSIDQWSDGIHHTNTIEGFWSWLKRGINGTHVWVSRKHLPKFLGEFEFRFNLRGSPHLMFDFLLAAFPRP